MGCATCKDRSTAIEPKDLDEQIKETPVRIIKLNEDRNHTQNYLEPSPKNNFTEERKKTISQLKLMPSQFIKELTIDIHEKYTLQEKIGEGIIFFKFNRYLWRRL